MGRPKKLAAGVFVEIAQSRNGEQVWLPFLVTDVRDADTVSGVGFTGWPGAVGWSNRGTEAFSNVEKGVGHRNWRHVGELSNGPPKDEPADDVTTTDAAEEDDTDDATDAGNGNENV